VVEAQTWNGSASDLWSNAANWTPNTVPNSTSATATVTNATNNPVLIDDSPTIANLTVGASNSVTLTNGETLTIAGGGGNGVLNNAGTITLDSTGSNTYLALSGTVSNTGGGSITMSNQPYNIIYGSGTLINDTSNTIQGAGVIGNGSNLTLVNQAQGTILANQSNALTIVSGGPVTNNGTFQANSGSLLNVMGNLTNYNFTTNTLTGGTFNAYSGTIQLPQANTGLGVVITTNAATILLDGASAKIADRNGNNILQGFFTTNTAAGSFTIQNGANLTTASTGFSNAGTLNIGANSTFTVGGSNDYVQTGGTSTLAATTSGLAVASGHSVDINGGTLQGFGTITGNLSNTGGTIMPGTPGVAGILTATGNYSDPQAFLDIQIGGPNAGTGGFSQLNISGTAALGGTLDLSLINGFTPYNGELFEILTSSGLSGSFSDNTIHDGNVTFTVTYSPTGYPNDVVLDAHVASPIVPEPASWLMLGLGLTAVGTCVVRKSKSQVRGK